MGCIGGYARGGAYVYLPPDAPHANRDRRRGIAVWGVSGYARGGAYVYLPPDAPHANRGRRRGIAVLGCVGVCQRENDDG